MTLRPFWLPEKEAAARADRSGRSFRRDRSSSQWIGRARAAAELVASLTDDYIAVYLKKEADAR